MKIYVEVPDRILDMLYERGYTQKERNYFFKSYLASIMFTMDDNFQVCMEEWLDELTEEEIKEIKEGKNL
jgi:DNA topoisomerase IA